MKQKRSKSQLVELESSLQKQPGTGNGGSLDARSKNGAKESECSSGVCAVIWKPDSVKR